ncbi:MAG: MipA/OmpV family protein [Lysobacteraceae bacterium]|nr:MAG: MipA/OmpV family protein [Xanthomonadaceae bacterium]
MPWSSSALCTPVGACRATSGNRMAASSACAIFPQPVTMRCDMKNLKPYSSGIALGAALALSPGVEAQDQVPVQITEQTNQVGLGILSAPDYYGSTKNEGVAAPLLRYSWDGMRYVQLLGSELLLNLSAVPEWRIGPVVRVRTRRDDDVDDEVIARMRPIASATEVGVFAAYHMPLDPAQPLHKLVFSADIVGNTNNVYDGATGNLRVNYMYPFQNPVMGRPVIGSIGFGMFFASSDFTNRYFGVAGSDTPLFPELRGRIYNAESSLTSIKIPFTLSAPLNKEWRLTFAGRYERLLEDAKDSPVVRRRGDADQWTLGVAAMYQF